MIELSDLGEPLIQAWSAGMLRGLVQGSLALGCVWLACRFLGWLPPRLQQWLWRAAYLKLLLALLVVPSVGLDIPIPAPSGPPDSDLSTRPGPPRAVSPGLHPPRPAPQPPVTHPPVPSPALSCTRPLPTVNWTGVLFGLWLGGALVSLGVLLRERRGLRELRARSRPVRSPELSAFQEALCRELGLRRAPELLETQVVAAPLLVGIRKPALIFPAALAEGFDREELRLILAHELVHVRRHDLLWACLPTLARLLFFFNPLVWLAEREWRLTTEMACDAEVMEMHPAARRGYARLLLELATQPLTKDSESLQSAGIAESYPTLRRRLTMIRNSASLPARRLKMLYSAAILGGGLVLVPWSVRAQSPDMRPLKSPLVSEAASRPPTRAGERRPANGTPVRVAGVPASERKIPRTPEPPLTGTSSPLRTGAPLDTRIQPAQEPVALDEQWEDVLVLEAIHYLRLSPAQLRQLTPLAAFAAEKQEKLRAEERQVRVELAGIIRENRAALLRGGAGFRQEEAVRLDQRLKRRSAETEAEIGRYVMPRLVRLLSREQVARALLLTLGRPVRDANRPASAALLDPASGFVQGMRTVLSQRYSEQVLDTADRVEKNLHGDDGALLVTGASPQARREHELIVNGLARALRNHGREWTEEELQKEQMENWSRQFYGTTGVNAQVDAARQERYELQVRPEQYARQMTARGTVEELSTVLRLFAERLFLSSRLKPVLEERLKDLDGIPTGRTSKFAPRA